VWITQARYPHFPQEKLQQKDLNLNEKELSKLSSELVENWY
jgi:hypothetical protein